MRVTWHDHDYHVFTDLLPWQVTAGVTNHWHILGIEQETTMKLS